MAAEPTATTWPWWMVRLRRDTAAIAQLVPSVVRLLPRLVKKWREDSRTVPLDVRRHGLVYLYKHVYSWHTLGRLPNIAAPDFVRDRIGEEYLVPVYQIATSFESLDLDALPERFVLKTNNDSGTVSLVFDKASMDWAAVRDRVTWALARVYGRKEGEWAYAQVPPRVFAEALLLDASGARPHEYKIHCFDGRAVSCQRLEPERRGRVVRIARDGSILPTRDRDGRILPPDPTITAPPEWPRMVELADRLAAGEYYLRVDLYLSGGRIYAGELTPYTASGAGGGSTHNESGRGQLVTLPAPG